MKNFRYIMLATLFGSVSLSSQAEAIDLICKRETITYKYGKKETSDASKYGEFFVNLDLEGKRLAVWFDGQAPQSAEYAETPDTIRIIQPGGLADGARINRKTLEMVQETGLGILRGTCRLYEPEVDGNVF